jgi:ribosome-interacting GTPase 1
MTSLHVSIKKNKSFYYNNPHPSFLFRYDATADDLIDVVEGNRSYMPCIYLLNKIDQGRDSPNS